MTNKTELRRRLRSARSRLDPAEAKALGGAMTGRLRQIVDWTTITKLHCFEPIAGLGEPDISGFISYVEQNYPNVQLYTSRRAGTGWRIVHLPDGRPAAGQKFDVIIVPALGFDPVTLHRVGYGGGYYDKFLAARPQAKKIGVCFENGKVSQIPAEPYDIQMDLIVTESNLYNYNRRV